MEHTMPEPATEHSPGEETAEKTRSFPVKPAVAVLVLVAIGVASRFIDIQGMLRDTLGRVEELGWLGAGIFVLLYIGACVFLVPGSVLSLGAGAIYGLARGFALVSVASTLGATAAFLVGRYVARGWVAKKVEGNAKFKAIDDAVAGEGWKIVGLTRLSPVFPFNLLNYAYGLTRVSLRDYVLASWIGMMPGTVLFVYIGSLAGNIATIDTAAAGGDSPGKIVMQGVGLLATLVVTVYITRIARRALDAHVETDEASD